MRRVLSSIRRPHDDGAIIWCLLRDLQTVIRQCWRAPAFVVTAALTLALGVGANTAIFGVINGFSRPLPVPAPEQIVVIAASLPGDETGLRYRFSFPAVRDYRRLTTSFSDIFGFDIRIGGLGANGKTSQFVYQILTGNTFPALGLTPAAGRLFERGEGEFANAGTTIVLGHSYWMRRFGGDLSIVDTVARLDGRPARIVGVAPAGFAGLSEGAVMDGYLTLGGAQRSDVKPEMIFDDRSIRPITMMGRLKPGVTIAEAQAEVDSIAARLSAEYPAVEHGASARVIPERLARPFPWPALSSLMPSIQFFLILLSSVVLLIACLNVANLLLVRVTVREREMAVRASLGAGRWRLIRLLLLESLLLAVMGTSIGLGLGRWLTVMFVNSIDLGTDVPFKLDATYDWRVFTYSTIATIVTGIVIGVLPARRASRAALTGVLHDGGRSGSAGASRRRVRSALVVAQIAGSLVLLIVAGLFVRNLHKAQQVDLGFDPRDVMSARLDTQHLGYDAARSEAFYQELDRRLHAIPGVESASQSFTIPLSWVIGSYLAWPEDQKNEDQSVRPALGANSVTPAFFETMRIPILRGRNFGEGDVASSKRVAIVNEVMAERFWPGQEAIGKRIVVRAIPGDPWEIVGVARTTKYMAVFEHPLPHFYLPQAQNPSFLRSVQVRSSALSMDELRIRIEREIAALDPELPIADFKSVDRLISGNIGYVLFGVGAWQATAMGLLGLTLAVIGVYGVVSYQTAQREKEIGIRIALGAVPWDVRRLVLRDGVGLVLLGVTIGLVVTFVATMTLGRMIVFVSTTDPIAFVGVTAALTMSALAACYLPARRATKIEPVVALRQE
jgi:predicted permease